MTCFNKTKESGFTLIAAVMIIFSVGIFGMGLIQLMSVMVEASNDEVEESKALYIGQAGLEYAKRRIYSGQDPAISNASLNNGSFTVTSTPTTRTATVASQYGKANQTQTISTNFAQHIASFNSADTVINGNELESLKLTKVTSQSATLAKMWFTWNWHSCVTSQTYNAVTNDLSGCAVDTGGAVIQRVAIDGTQIYNPGSGIGSPGGGGASSGQEIDVVDFTLTGSGTQSYIFYGPPQFIKFSESLPTNGLYTITIEFTDQSQISTTFQR